MLIRCEKCSTVYELEDRLIPPQGAPVQCSKCQHVFRAFPPSQSAAPQPEPRAAPPAAVREPPAREPAETAAGPVAGVPREAEHALDDAAPVDDASAVRRATPGSLPPAGSLRTPLPQTAPEEPQYTADGRPIRKVPFPVSDPPQPGPRPVLVGGPVRTAKGGGWIPPGLRRWLVPLIIGVLLAIVLIGVRAFLARRGDAGAARRPAGQSQLVPAGAAEPPARTVGVATGASGG